MTWKGVAEPLRYPVLYAVWLQAAFLAPTHIADAFAQHPVLMLLAYNVVIGAVLLVVTVGEAVPKPSGGDVRFAEGATTGEDRPDRYTVLLATGLVVCILLWVFRAQTGSVGPDDRDARALGWIMAGLLLGVITGPLSALPLFLFLGLVLPPIRVSGSYTLELGADIGDVLRRRRRLDGLEMPEIGTVAAREVRDGVFDLTPPSNFLSKLDGRRTISIAQAGDNGLVQTVASDRGFSSELRLVRSGRRISGVYYMESARMIDKLAIRVTGPRRYAKLAAQFEAHRLSRMCASPVAILQSQELQGRPVD